MKRVFLLAGEASGDLHGALLAEAIRRRRPDCELWGVGGERMEAAGVRLILRSEELAVVGFLEVLEKANRLLGALETVRSWLAAERPDLFIPVDFPDFNFRLLPAAFRLGIPIVYYISPQVWAWRSERIDILRRYLRLMIVIFPFEESLYLDRGVPVRWVGHPFVDRLAPAAEPEAERTALGLASEGPVVALLPGSRRSEIGRIAPVLRKTRFLVDEARRSAGKPPVLWIAGLAPGLPESALEALELGPADPQRGPDPVGRRPEPGPAATPEAEPERSRHAPLNGIEALKAADLALVASGTITLEAALLGRPVIVVYRVHPWTYRLARRLVRIDHIAMANLIAGRRLVPEFLQDAADPPALAAEVERLLSDRESRDRMRAGLLEVRARLGPPGAADRAAEAALAVMDGGTGQPTRIPESGWTTEPEENAESGNTAGRA